jgi:predicted  nucleic acid-binding Zn-ribbon protein
MSERRMEKGTMFATQFGKKHRLIATLALAVLFWQLIAATVHTAYSCTLLTGKLDIEADVGSIHFRGELAEFYMLISYLGEPVEAEISAILYYNGTMHADLTTLVEYVATGVYRVPYAIPIEDSAGTYSLVVNASTCGFKGTTLKAFLLSPTLTSWNAWIINVQGDMATIRTDIATIKVSLETINARLTSIDERIATIETDIGSIQTDISTINTTLQSINGTMVTVESNVGEIQVSLTQINAKLVALNETVATIQTDVGNIETSIEDIQLKITRIEGDIATISTTLGDIEGTIVTVQGDIATIKTDIGEIKASLSSAQTTGLGTPLALILIAIAAIALIVSVAALLRKRKETVQ